MDEQTQPVNLTWDQSEDEVAESGGFKDGNTMPEDEYNFRIGKTFPITDRDTGMQKLSNDGIPMYKLQFKVVGGQYDGYDCGQLIWSQPDPNHPAYGQKWAQMHDISRGLINRIVKTLNLPAVATLQELEGAEFRAEWKATKNPKYMKFGYMQAIVPQHPGHEPQAPEHAGQVGTQELKQAPVSASQSDWG